jgi:hypothetical protein
MSLPGGSPSYNMPETSTSAYDDKNNKRLWSKIEAQIR